MTRKLLLAGMAALVLGMAPQAQAIGPFLSWQNAEDLDNGYGIGAAFPRSFTPLIRIDPRVTWFNYGDNDPSLNVVPIDLMAELSLGLFYGGVGVSYSIIDNDLKDVWGYTGVIGAKISLAGFGVFGDFVWRGAEESNGARIDGPGFNIGVLFME